ncbi:hypothetical protein IE077_000712 [Cardiosporidium cionae]|uniref:FCP1 homology domain-containing protein n=1 Tax=Cardiosporidium cionae TaxID=476202 RepID=A0ABQ7JE17_9APIC|nr:hypothetical protein IE077_000712 [Cardiosporidium cionae]|eukprot:KAF8822249.1 hypothetical protein IE077_000712 [Cardiosporidium cionae]
MDQRRGPREKLLNTIGFLSSPIRKAAPIKATHEPSKGQPKASPLPLVDASPAPLSSKQREDKQKPLYTSLIASIPSLRKNLTVSTATSSFSKNISEKYISPSDDNPNPLPETLSHSALAPTSQKPLFLTTTTTTAPSSVETIPKQDATSVDSSERNTSFPPIEPSHDQRRRFLSYKSFVGSSSSFNSSWNRAFSSSENPSMGTTVEVPLTSPSPSFTNVLRTPLEISSSSTEDAMKEEAATEEDLVFEMNLMHLKGKDDFRVNYLRRLSYRNVWVPNSRKPPTHQTVIIFDWDDTLLCTSYIHFCGDEIEYSPVKKHFDAIQNFGELLLKLALKLGKVFIITNAREGWVEFSCKKYVPQLWTVLEKIPVISARHFYENEFPGNYHEWKVRAFKYVREELNSQIITNLISVGDSNIEMDAVHVMGKEFEQALVKTIKFRECPLPDELAKQLELIYLKFDKLCDTPRNLKIMLERKGTSAAAARLQPPKAPPGSVSPFPSSGASVDSSTGQNEMAQPPFSGSGAGNLGIQQKLFENTPSNGEKVSKEA